MKVEGGTSGAWDVEGVGGGASGVQVAWGAAVVCVGGGTSGSCIERGGIAGVNVGEASGVCGGWWTAGVGVSGASGVCAEGWASGDVDGGTVDINVGGSCLCFTTKS